MPNGSSRTKAGGIAGIRADDGTGRIVIHLVKPRGTFSNELGLLYVALLPRGTPANDLTEHPAPATGPYEITDVDPGRGWHYARNPVWSSTNSEAMPELPSGHVDAIRIEVVSNPASQVNDVESGRSDWMKNPPPPDRIAEIKAKYEGTQFRQEPTISNFYFWMNTSKPPFDDVRVRRAVNYAIDPAALERIYSDTLTSTQQVLPPGMPGHEKFVLYPHDLAKARELIARADPADRDITVWTDSAPPNNEAGEYYEGVLRGLGFQPRLKAVSAATYFSLIGNASTPDLDTGWSNWLLDYPHPNDYFQPQLSGESIQPDEQHQLGPIRRPEAERENLPARSRTARGQADRRIRAARSRSDGEGAMGAVRQLHDLDLRLQRDRPGRGHRQPDLRTGPDQLPLQVRP